MKQETYATRTHPAQARTELLRSIALPAVVAVVLIVLFFILLLTGPATVSRHARIELPAAPTTTVIAEPAKPSCPVPIIEGRAGVVAERFHGKPTSSGARYHKTGAVCMVNAASELGSLEAGTKIRVTRTDVAGKSEACEIVGTWNGQERTQRLVLVSSAVAKRLGIGKLGLAEIVTGCADETHSTLTADASLGH